MRLHIISTLFCSYFHDRTKRITTIDLHHDSHRSGCESDRGSKRIHRQLLNQCLQNLPWEGVAFSHKQFLHSFMRKQPGSIRTLTHQGIKHINQSADLGHFMDLSSLEAMGIAPSVPSFMGLTCYLRQPMQRRVTLENDLDSAFRVLFDQRPFFRSESATLAQ